MAVEVGAVRRRSDERVQKEERRGMAQSRQKFAFARCGASVALAATLSLSMVPATALAEVGSDAQGGAVATSAADTIKTNDGFYMDKGKVYSLPVTYSSDMPGLGSVAAGMLQGYFGNNVKVSANDDGSYAVVIYFGGTNGYSAAIEDITYNGQVVKQANQEYSLTASSIKDALALNIVIGGAMAGMFEDGIDYSMAIDTSSLSTEDPSPDPQPGDDVTAAKAELQALVDEAKKLAEEGAKGEDAVEALNKAIATAEAALGNDDIPAAGVQGVKAMLQEAIDTYNASGSGSENPDEQTVSVSYFVKDSGSAFSSMLPGEVQATKAEQGYDINIPVAANTIEMVNGTFWVKDASGADAAMVEGEDGSRTYTLHVDSLEGAFEFSMGYEIGPVKNTHNMIARFFDCTAINEALASAKKIADDGTEAYKTFAAAFEAAKEVVKNPAATQVQLAEAAASLNAAIDAFNNQGQEPAENPYGMEVGKTYTASVSYEGTGAFANLNDMLKEMVAKYFGNAVQLVAKSDGTYDVIVYFGGTTGYDDAIGDLTYNGQAIKQASNRTYTINVPSLDSAIGLGLHVGGTMNMDITYAMTVDTSTIKLQEGGSEPPVAEVDKTGLQQIVDQAAAMTQGKKSDAAWASLQETLAAARAILDDANATQAQVNEAATALKDAIDRFNSSQDVLFQVGHTYEVPIAFFKHGSVTETSMAAKYLGDTALVRPQENGTFQVSFAATSEGLGYIKSLSYNGSAIAQSGNQFTLSIPAAESDVVIPIEMAITMMQQLGIGQSQTADMHLYLSQAKDLGTGQASLAASSSNLAQTGDSTTGAATLAVGVAVAGAAAAVAARRRLSQQK